MSRLPKYLAEAVGTFCLVFAGTGAIALRAATGGQVSALEVCLVFGLVVLAMVYAVGHISGAHLNPAVTFAFFWSGRLGGAEVAPYCAAQLCGAAAASLVVRVLFGAAGRLGATGPSAGVGQAFLMEFLLTAILVLVIMSVATDHRAQGGMAGIAIGATVCLCAILGGPVSGASMNPARSFGPALVGLDFTRHWLYWAAPVLGAAAGASLYRLIRCDERRAASAAGCC